MKGRGRAHRDERERLRRLERGNRELRRADEILKSAVDYFGGGQYLILEPRAHEDGVALEGHLLEPAPGLECHPSEVGLIQEDRSVEAHPALEGCLLELCRLQYWTLILIGQSFEETLEEFSSELHATRINGVILTNAFEFGVESGKVPSGGVGQTPDGRGEPDADAPVVATRLPRDWLVVGHGPHWSRRYEHAGLIVASTTPG
jgi:hypothetical protein